MLNQALKAIRQYHKLTQTELAQAISLSVSQISEMETGKNTISLETLKKYADYFDVPVSHLMLFAEQIEHESLKTEKVRKFVAKKILDIMNWQINRDERKSKEKNQNQE